MGQKLKIIGIISLVIITLSIGNLSLSLFKEDEVVEEQNNLCEQEICTINKEDMAYYGLEPFVSNLPVLMIDTEGKRVGKAYQTWGTIGILDNSEKQNAVEGQSYSAISACTVNLRGASSYSGFDKPQLRLKLYDKQGGEDYNYALCGLPEDSEWVLNGPFLDKTAVRNTLIYGLAQTMEVWSPKTAYVEVFMNG